MHRYTHTYTYTYLLLTQLLLLLLALRLLQLHVLLLATLFLVTVILIIIAIITVTTLLSPALGGGVRVVPKDGSDVVFLQYLQLGNLGAGLGLLLNIQKTVAKSVGVWRMVYGV
ncbi:hypothetical protein EON65_51735 [archaeon]|nr:MAG: hypothetical protein EON65_51735 [archaeon]